jgi:hypothetical protein
LLITKAPLDGGGVGGGGGGCGDEGSGVDVVVVLSQTCNLRLTRAAMISVWIRKISKPKSLNRQA